MLTFEQFAMSGVRIDGAVSIDVLSGVHHRLRPPVPGHNAGAHRRFPTLLHGVDLHHRLTQQMEARPPPNQTLRETRRLHR